MAEENPFLSLFSTDEAAQSRLDSTRIEKQDVEDTLTRIFLFTGAGDHKIDGNSIQLRH